MKAVETNVNIWKENKVTGLLLMNWVITSNRICLICLGVSATSYDI